MNGTDKIEDVLAKYIADPNNLRKALAEITIIVRDTLNEVFDRFEKENS